MTQINPFTWIAQAGQAPQSQAARERQLRRAQNLARNAALTGAELEHQVESADAVREAQDHDPNTPERRRQPARPRPRVDVKA
jgi:hypothetical protein